MAENFKGHGLCAHGLSELQRKGTQALTAIIIVIIIVIIAGISYRAGLKLF
jgi:hypothetical protein